MLRFLFPFLPQDLWEQVRGERAQEEEAQNKLALHPSNILLPIPRRLHRRAAGKDNHGDAAARHAHQAPPRPPRTTNHGNERTYNTLLMGLCKNRKLDKAVEVYKSMVGAGMKLETPAYATFVRALCRAGRVPDAYEVFDYSIESKSFAQVTAYSELESSLKWLRRIRHNGSVADNQYIKEHGLIISMICGRCLNPSSLLSIHIGALVNLEELWYSTNIGFTSLESHVLEGFILQEYVGLCY